MRPFAPLLLTALKEAELWQAMCIVCHSTRGAATEAEHALYHTQDGRKTTAAERIEAWWAVIPACRHCHRGEKTDKNINAKLALISATAAGVPAAKELVKNYPKRLVRVTAAQREAAEAWGRQVAAAAARCRINDKPAKPLRGSRL